MSTLFISDLHLDKARADVTATFLGLLQHYREQSSELYILGDLFEVWLGDDDRNSLIDQVIGALASWSYSGASIYIMHGNRDFLLGSQFCAKTGASLLEDNTVIELGGSPTLLLHGDSLCTDDVEYQNFRQQIRNSNAIDDLLNKPLGERRKIAADLRKMSQTANSNKVEYIMDVNQQAVEDLMRKHEVLRMIHGHTHRPAHHHFELDGHDAERIVLGDWGQSGWLIKSARDSVELISFPLLSID